MRTNYLIGLSLLGLAAGCGGGPKPAPPEPKPTEAEMAIHVHMQDSIALAASARADSVERVRLQLLAAQARADSIEQSRVAEAQRVRDSVESALRAATLLTDELALATHFDYDATLIQPEDQSALDRKVAIMKANPSLRLRIVAHTDDRGSEEYNLALGTRRAAATKGYLVGQGIDAARVEVASLGEGTPVDAGQNETAWARNRRAEFEIVAAPNPLMAPVAIQ